MSEAVAEIDAELSEVAEDEAALWPPGRWRALLFLLAFSPVVVLGFAIASCAVDVPLWDDWERGEMWSRHYDGTLDFQYMYSPHIEHRSLFPRLITFASGKWAAGDVRIEIWTIYALLVGTTLLCFQLMNYTLRGSPALWPATFLSNMLLCCPVQYTDFLWASMLAFMMPFLCLMSILVTSVSRLPVWAKFVVFVAALEVGTHSFSQGLVLWPVAVCLPLFSPSGFGRTRARALFAAGIAAIGIATLVPYFNWHFETTSHISHTYSTPTGERSSKFEKVTEMLKNPKPVREYFMKALGNPMVRVFDQHAARSARDVGRVVLALFVASMGFLFWRRRDGVTWARLLPWAAAACFAVSVAVLLALARSSSPHRATMPRYIPMTIFLLVALVAFAAYVVTWWSRQSEDQQTSARRAAWGWGSAAVLAVLLAGQWSYGLFKMGAWRDSRLTERAELIFIKLFDPKRIGRIDNTLEFSRKQAVLMNEHGLIHPPLVDEWGFGPFDRQAQSLAGDEARFHAHAIEDDGVSVSGFATLPSGRVADGVLVALKNDDEGEPEVLGFVEMHSALVPKNPFIDGHFGDGPDLSKLEKFAAFDGHISTGGREIDPSQLEFWALDAAALVAYRIGTGP